jgi:hypothetical protein
MGDRYRVQVSDNSAPLIAGLYNLAGDGGNRDDRGPARGWRASSADLWQGS